MFKRGDVISTSIGEEVRTSVIEHIEDGNVHVGKTLSTNPNHFWHSGRWLLKDIRYAKNSEKAKYIKRLEER